MFVVNTEKVEKCNLEKIYVKYNFFLGIIFIGVFFSVVFWWYEKVTYQKYDYIFVVMMRNGFFPAPLFQNKSVIFFSLHFHQTTSEKNYCSLDWLSILPCLNTRPLNIFCRWCVVILRNVRTTFLLSNVSKSYTIFWRRTLENNITSDVWVLHVFFSFVLVSVSISQFFGFWGWWFGLVWLVSQKKYKRVD